jgi:hypothetical protein
MDTISWRPKTTQNTQEDTDSEYSMSKSGSCPPHNMFIPVSKRDDNATRYNFAPGILFRNRNTCALDRCLHARNTHVRVQKTDSQHTLSQTHKAKGQHDNFQRAILWCWLQPYPHFKFFTVRKYLVRTCMLLSVCHCFCLKRTLTAYQEGSITNYYFCCH